MGQDRVLENKRGKTVLANCNTPQEEEKVLNKKARELVKKNAEREKGNTFIRFKRLNGFIMVEASKYEANKEKYSEEIRI
jgi:hypothetical protein